MSFFDFDFYEIVVWVATLILCAIAAASRRIPLRVQGGLGQPLPNPIAVILPIIFFTTFVALRKTIGDTYYYIYSFEMMPDVNEVTLELFFSSMYTFFQNIIRNLTDEPQWLIAFSAIFSIPVPLIVLYKYCPRFEMAIYMFVTFGYLGGAMNGMRQYMAASIVILGTKYLFSMKKSDFFKYAIIILFAYCMHNSAIIMLPIYFVVRRRAWQISSYLIIFASVIGVIAFDTILPSFLSVLEQTDYSVYATNGWFTSGTEGGSSLIRVIFIAFPLVVAYLNKGRLRMMGHIGDILINMMFLDVAIYMVAVYNWIFARLAVYLAVYFIIFAVWVFNYAVKPKDRTIYQIASAIVYFVYSRMDSFTISMYQSDYFFPGRKLF